MGGPARPQRDTVGIREVSVLAWARRVTLSMSCRPGSIDCLSETPELVF